MFGNKDDTRKSGTDEIIYFEHIFMNFIMWYGSNRAKTDNMRMITLFIIKFNDCPSEREKLSLLQSDLLVIVYNIFLL